MNTTLCKEYIREMASLGEDVLFQDDEPSAAGTDMGICLPVSDLNEEKGLTS